MSMLRSKRTLAALAVAAVIVLPVASQANHVAATVTTAAGTGVQGYSGDGGPATAAQIHRPRGIELLPDGGYVFAESLMHTIRHVSAGGTITTILGSPSLVGGYVEGPGATARFNMPFEIAVHPTIPTRIFIVDRGNNVIRQADLSGGTWTTSLFAGIPMTAGSVDGTRLGQATFNGPNDLVFDPTGSFLYVGDTTGLRIRRIDMSSGMVLTIAGDGTSGFLDHPTGTTAKFGSIEGIATNGSLLWVADPANNRIRAVSLSGSFPVTTVAGDGTAFVQDGTGTAAKTDDPRDLAFTSDGFVLFTEAIACVIRRFNPTSGQVLTVAGNLNVCSSTGDGGPATSATFNSPRNVVSGSSSGDYLVSENLGAKIREVGDVAPIPPDGDGDGVPDATDNCPAVANANQANNDGDAAGDACDPDDDNDGIADAADACPVGALSGTDTDGDGCKDSEDSNDDGDALADATDRCDLVAAATPSGCPAKARRLTLAYRAAIDKFSGRLSATGAPACASRKRVTIFRAKPGPDRRIGGATTRTNGSFSLTRAVAPGRYYATASATVIENVAACGKATSRNVQVQ